MAYAVIVGEALVDLFEAESDGESIYRPIVGGAPLNVAAGLARLGAPVEFVTALSSDALGDRIRDLLRKTGVGTRACVTVDVPTTLAVTTLRGTEPDFHFYGQPPTYAMLGPQHIDPDLIGNAGALYCGSIALLQTQTLAAARAAWSMPGPLRLLDPNVRPTLLRDAAQLRGVIEEFAATADVVKLSDSDADSLFGLAAHPVAAHLRAIGAGAVIVTLGRRGALASVGDSVFEVPPPEVNAIDTTGAGDAAMAGLMYGVLDGGLPTTQSQWRSLVDFAVAVGSFACEIRGGATAMPSLAAVQARSR